MAGQTHILGGDPSDPESVAVSEGDAFPEITDAALIVWLRNHASAMLGAGGGADA
jgi:hypothetical protein